MPNQESLSLLRIILEAKDKNTKDVLNGVGRSLSSLGSVATGVVLGGLTLAAGAIAGIGVAAFNVANDLQTTTKDIQASLGLTAEEAQRVGRVALEVFGDNFAGSIEEAGDAVVIVRQQLKKLNEDELADATKNAFRLADTFDVDLNSSLNAASVLMEQFGLSQEEAFDLITTGFQRGLDTSGDFLESITEYGNLFGQAGASADQFFSVLESGLQGGVLGTDKAGDLFKEFTVRLVDGSKTTGEAMTALFGDSTQAIFDQIRDGSLTSVEAFDLINQSIASIEDPLLKNQLGVALMGTQFEDMGADAVAAINLTSTSLSEMAGATDGLNVKYETLGALIEGAWRKIQVVMVPIGEKLLELGNMAMPVVETALARIGEALPIVTDKLTQFGDWIFDVGIPAAIEFAQPIIDQIIPAVEDLNTQGQALAADALALMTKGFADFKSGLDIFKPIFDAVATVISTRISEATMRFDDFNRRAAPIFLDFTQRFKETWDAAGPVIKDAFERISVAIGDMILALGLAKEGSTNADEAIVSLKSALDAIVIGVQLVTVTLQGIAWALEQVSAAIQIAIGLWDQMGQIVEEVGDRIPEWLRPGSPPPLFFALRDINRALDEMPDLDDKFSFDGQPPPGAGASAMTGGLVAAPASTNGGGHTFNITIHANDEEGGRRAGNGFVDSLRDRGLVLT